MTQKGFSHIALSTLDMDKTTEFYHQILGFDVARSDTITVTEGGKIRHTFFHTGRDQYLAFMELKGVPGVPTEYDAGINRALGLPNACYHFAFEAGTEAELGQKREELLAHGVAVTEIVDHETAKSIYFADPNGLQLEYCCFTQAFAGEAEFEVSLERLGLAAPPAA